MNEVIATVVGGLIVSFITGCATLAFKKPKGFGRVALPLMIALSAFNFAGLAFVEGLREAGNFVEPHLTKQAIADLVVWITQVQYVLFATTGVSIFLQLLFWLPRWIGDD